MYEKNKTKKRLSEQIIDIYSKYGGKKIVWVGGSSEKQIAVLYSDVMFIGVDNRKRDKA